MNEILNDFSMHLYILCHLINEDFIQHFKMFTKMRGMVTDEKLRN